MANDVSAAIRYFRDSVRTALTGRTFRLSLQLSTLRKALSSPSMATIPEDRGRRFYDEVECFLERIQDNFLLEASLRYAVIEKNPLQLNESSPLVTGIPTHVALAGFLRGILNIDKVLGHKFVSSLSKMNGNADPSKTDDDLIEELLRTDNVRVFQEVAALTEASANFHILGDLDRCVEECRKVNDSPSYLQNTDLSIFLISLSMIYPGTEDYGSFRDGLHAELEQKRRIFTVAEYNAIVGLPAPATTEVIDESPKETSSVEPSIQQWSVPRDHRVTRPPSFAGDKGERAFQCLYDLMKDVYFVSTLVNFTGLFRCPPDETVESYTKINWIHKSGQVGLKWFLEALYRSKRDVKGSADRMRSDFSNIFLVHGKPVDVQDNPIYCWKRNFVSVDKTHKHEKEIQNFLDLMNKAGAF